MRRGRNTMRFVYIPNDMKRMQTDKSTTKTKKNNKKKPKRSRDPPALLKANKNIENLLVITKLDGLFNRYQDEEEAIYGML